MNPKKKSYYNYVTFEKKFWGKNRENKVNIFRTLCGKCFF